MIANYHTGPRPSSSSSWSLSSCSGTPLALVTQRQPSGGRTWPGSRGSRRSEDLNHFLDVLFRCPSAAAVLVSADPTVYCSLVLAPFIGFGIETFPSNGGNTAYHIYIFLRSEPRMGKKIETYRGLCPY